MSQVIVSLSTIPPRFGQIQPTLRSLINQSTRADRVLLYIPDRYRRFPDWSGRLPEVPEGVEIRRTADDLGPATKVLIAAREFRGSDTEIVFCDDDRIYGRDFVSDFLDTRRRRQDCAIANIGFLVDVLCPCSGLDRPQPQTVRTWRVTDVAYRLRYLKTLLRGGRQWREVKEPWRNAYKRSGFVDIFEGCAGVMARPEFFPEEAYDIPPVLWTVDDVWLSGMLRKNGVGIWLRGNQLPPEDTAAGDAAPLVEAVVDGADRHTANRMAVEYFQKTHEIWL